MKNKKYATIPLILILLLSINACDNEIELTTKGKDITVVYGLLSIADTTHYIKINKAYQCDDNAIEYASDLTNTTYADSLSVILKEYNGSSYTGNYIVFDDTLIEREKDLSSPFYDPEYPFQPIFKGKGVLNEDREYYVEIVNTETGKKVSSSTEIVKNFSLTSPNSGAHSWGISITTTQTKVKWNSSEGGRLYDLVIRFHYYERNLTTSEVTSSYIDWEQTSQTASSLDGGDEMYATLSGASFYSNIVNNLEQDNNLERCAGTFEFIISVAADEFAIYCDLASSTSSSIVSERPSYTNINNGIGIFSSRYTKHATYDVSAIVETELVNGETTSGLGFISNNDFFN